MTDTRSQPRTRLCRDLSCRACLPARRMARARRRDFVLGFSALLAFVSFLALMEGVTVWIFS